MSNLTSVFVALKNTSQKAFIAYITAGDPDRGATLKLAKTLVKSGVDVLELGVPFSEPVADGPVNQRANERALKQNVSLRDVLTIVRTLRDEGMTTPIVLFTYINPVFRIGYGKFAEEAAAAGVDGVLAVDLPPEEAAEYARALRARKVDTIFLVSPTTGRTRAKQVNELSSGFVYYVSRTGVTGTREELAPSLAQDVRGVRDMISLPIAIGFGISTPAQAKEVARLGDGVVVGSALVRLVEEHAGKQELYQQVESFARSLNQAIKR